MIDNAEDLDIAMLMCNLIENSKNYRKTTGSLRNYYRQELSDATNNNNSPNEKIITSKPFKHKTGITGDSIDYNVAENITNNQGNEIDNSAYDANKIGVKEAKIAVPLKYLSNFLKNLDIPFINCKIIFDFNLVCKLCNF